MVLFPYLYVRFRGMVVKNWKFITFPKNGLKDKNVK
jgi:hypothetical protein